MSEKIEAKPNLLFGLQRIIEVEFVQTILEGVLFLHLKEGRYSHQKKENSQSPTSRRNEKWRENPQKERKTFEITFG
jgi:hypothetical protein